MRPFSRTTILSARRIVERRCAITITVRPSIKLARARCTSTSDSVSRCDVASSRIKIAAFANPGIIAERKIGDKVSRKRRARGLLDEVARQVGPPIRNIVRHCIVEQKRLLGNQTNLFAQAADGYAADIAPVDSDDARSRIEESRQQIH